MNNWKTKVLCLIYFISISALQYITGQDCFDADFESGTIGGYSAYHGSINNDGVVVFPSIGNNPTQHRIMKIEDGYDPIAEQFCFENKNLLVTGSGTGKYTLRLGDAVNGSRTSKIVLSFDVTEEVSFFLLKYAVVISDPGHPHEVQPRFELNIKDNDGNILDCGEYKVRASADIPGFESCGQWRVRPWTTAGFELKSYIGETINIEILSTDCGYGAHGGYAYIDATCTPLELDLQSYCPGTGFAKYVVTEGFDSYLWSTGETSRILNIDNPSPGQEYSVTVTSSTGCTLVLTDTLPTLPNIDDLEVSYFDPPDTLTVCFGEEVIYQPSGTNITEVFAIELDYSSDVFYLFAEESTTYNFVTTDNLGCANDTSQLVLNVLNVEFDYEVISTCENDSNGEILINTLGDNSIMTELNSNGYSSINHFKGLPPGEHTLRITNSTGCVVTKSVIIVAKEPPEIESIIVQPATCDKNNGRIWMSANNSAMRYSFDEGTFGPNSIWDGLSGGTYSITYKVGDDGCLDNETVVVETYGPPIVNVSATDSSYCGEADGFIALKVSDGYPPFKYSIDGMINDTSIFLGLSEGEYTFEVIDASNCRDTINSKIVAAPYLEIDSVNISHAFCEGANGSINLVVSDESIGNSLFIDSINHDTYEIGQLWGDSYLINTIDRNGCTDTILVEVNQIPAPVFDSIIYSENPCGIDFVNIEVFATSYNDSIQFSSERGPITNSSLFKLYPGDHTLIIQDDLGCIVDTLVFIQSEARFLLANIFSPNEDGVNDFFCFQPTKEVKFINQFQIYDRWGNKVFKIDKPTLPGPSLCWDGKFNNTYVESGVYVYYYQARLTDGRMLCKTGDVTVLR